MIHEHHFTLRVDEDTQASLEAVFPGGPVISSVGDVMQEGFAHFSNMLSGIHHTRKESAISGAMRWPWSQEYPLTQPRLIKR